MNTSVTVGTVGLGGESVFLKVDHFHAPGETLRARDLFREPGGKAYNQAVAAARLGASALFIGAAGPDDSGRLCREVLLREGVEPILELLPRWHTAYASILTDRTGENQVTVSPGAAAHLSREFVLSQEAAIARCTHLILGLECPPEATEAALGLARAHGVFTILNPAPASPLPLSLLRRFDLITPNLQEISVLLGLKTQPEPDALVPLLRRAGLTGTVVTLGSRGALLVTDREALLYPAARVTPVDTTGAGDTFNAALAVALGRGLSLKEAMEYAVNASACSVTAAHVLPSLPTRETVEARWQSLTPERLP